MKISGNIIDLHARRIFFGEITVENGRIQQILPKKARPSRRFILPGFVDAHVHIESSMLVPSEFARLAVIHGTVATVSDPHEIANVCGMDGVRFMLENGRKVPFKFHFGAPSCVPATGFETAGAVLDAEDVAELLAESDIFYLSEMMNWPGVLFNDAEVFKKIAAAKAVGKPIDGHAPGLRGEQAKTYFSAGISTDHECFSYEEGLEKAQLGVKILIREGSAAKNFEALIGLLPQFPAQIMFCSDDKHPDDLVNGHMDQLVKRALKKGCNLFDVLTAASVNPVVHYQLPVGLLKENDAADFIVCEANSVEEFIDFKVIETYINGQLVAKNGRTKIKKVPVEPINHFNRNTVKPSDFSLKVIKNIAPELNKIRVIKALNGEIVTDSFLIKPLIKNNEVLSDLNNDILKFSVINRYQENSVPAIAFIQNFGLKTGAIASCVGHDSHNILVVGCDDKSMAAAVNLLVKNKGGIAAVGSEKKLVLPLPVAGIMSAGDGRAVAKIYQNIDFFVKNTLGCTLDAPFMTLSFMALLVIPELKLSDLGLFDGKKFEFVPLLTANG